MSVRRVSAAAAFILAVAVSIAFAQARVTVILTNGQQYSGRLVAQNGSRIELAVGGQQMSWPQHDIAVIEFTPGAPDPQELSRLPWTNGPGFPRSTAVAVVLRSGQVVTGRLTGIASDSIMILTPSNYFDKYFTRNVARLYLNLAAARSLFALNLGRPGSGAVGTSGREAVTVDARQPWTPTGVFVRRGEQVAFDATGRVRWGTRANQVAGPEGRSIAEEIGAGRPLPAAAVGALIGRVGNGQPFLIGAYNQPIAMPTSGPLYLGINDNRLRDNSGGFSVRVIRER